MLQKILNISIPFQKDHSLAEIRADFINKLISNVKYELADIVLPKKGQDMIVHVQVEALTESEFAAKYPEAYQKLVIRNSAGLESAVIS